MVNILIWELNSVSSVPYNNFLLAPPTLMFNIFTGLSVQLSEELDRAEDDELEEEKVSLPCYLPALMGCRNVESYEWLNKIEEGTYGVVHRAKDKKTGILKF